LLLRGDDSKDASPPNSIRDSPKIEKQDQTVEINQSRFEREVSTPSLSDRQDLDCTDLKKSESRNKVV